MYLELGEFTLALKTMTLAERQSVEANFLGSKIILPGLIALTYLYLGDFETSMKAIERALEDADSVEVFKGRIQVAQAWWHLQNGELDQANELMQQASGRSEQEGPDLFVGTLIRTIELDIHLANEKYQVALEKAEKYLASVGKDAERLREEYQKQAENALKLDLALTKIAEEEGVKVTDKEIKDTLKAAQADPNFSASTNSDVQKASIRAALAKRAALEQLVALL